MSEGLKGTGLENGPPYDYTYKVPSTLDEALDTPRFLVSGRTLERAGVLLQAAQIGEVSGVIYAPQNNSNSDMEYRVSKRLFNIIKNTPCWYASQDELRSLSIDIAEAAKGNVLGVLYDSACKESRKYKISTVRYKALELLVENMADMDDL